ncbi:MAG: glycosyltransferase family 4 protein [Candidatus Woesearchaeota archaeon]
MKKIYLICKVFNENSGSYAGFFEEFAKYASKKGYKVIILCGRTSKKVPSFEKKHYAEIYRFDCFAPKIPFIGQNLSYIILGWHVSRYFKKNPALAGDIIIANALGALGVLKQRYVLRINQPAQVFLRNMKIAKNYSSLVSRFARKIHYAIIQARLEALCVKNAAAFLFPSRKTQKLIFANYGKILAPFFVPCSGVKFNELQQNKKLPIKGIKLLFVSAGNKERIRKGVIYLEQILPELFAKFKELKLIHVGDKFEWNVPEWCKERIISVGRVPWSRMKDYYKTADIFVSCSLHEGFPNALLEAMAAGTPIVTSDIEGIEEYIRHGKEGLIFRRGDTKELRECIEYLLKNPSIRKQMAEKAFARARTLDYSIYAKKLLYFIEKIYENEKDSQIHINLLERNKSI